MIDVQSWEALSKFQQWVLLYFSNYENVEKPASVLVSNSCLTSMENVENMMTVNSDLKELVKYGFISKSYSNSEDYFKGTALGKLFVMQLLMTLKEKVDALVEQKNTGDLPLELINKIHNETDKKKFKEMKLLGLKNTSAFSALVQLLGQIG